MGSTVECAVVGELDLVSGAQLRRHLESIDAEITQVVVDLRGVSFVDSSGLNVLLAVGCAMREVGRELVVRPSTSVERILVLAGVDQVITVLD